MQSKKSKHPNKLTCNKIKIWVGLLFLTALHVHSYGSTSQKTHHISTDPLPLYWTIPLLPVSLLAPGSAHYFRGEKEISSRMLRSSLSAVGSALVAGVILAVTGAADAVILPTIPIVLVGLTSWFSVSFADLVGSTLQEDPALSFQNHWPQTWSLSLRHRRVDDYFFATQSYEKITGQYWWGEQYIQAGFECNPNRDICLYELGYGKQLLSYQNLYPREGLYVDLSLSHEDNFPGYYSQNSINYKLKSILNLAVIGAHLHRLVATHEVGIQQHLIHYHSSHFKGNQSSSSLTGGFDLSWSINEIFKSQIGYIHERDTSISGLSTGFTGVYYLGAEFRLFDHYIASGKTYLGDTGVFDLAIEARF